VDIVLWVLVGYSVIGTFTHICLWYDYKKEREKSWDYEAKFYAGEHVINALVWKHGQLATELGRKPEIYKVWAEYEEHLLSKKAS
jgi:hypothetical protein